MFRFKSVINFRSSWTVDFDDKSYTVICALPTASNEEVCLQDIPVFFSVFAWKILNKCFFLYYIGSDVLGSSRIERVLTTTFNRKVTFLYFSDAYYYTFKKDKFNRKEEKEMYLCVLLTLLAATVHAQDSGCKYLLILIIRWRIMITLFNHHIFMRFISYYFRYQERSLF